MDEEARLTMRLLLQQQSMSTETSMMRAQLLIIRSGVSHDPDPEWLQPYM